MMGTALIVEDHPEQADLVARDLRLRNYESIWRKMARPV